MIQLTRVSSSDKGTFGVISVDEIPLCVTCEDPWHNNQHDISCIPLGAYQCKKYSGTKFKGVWQVMNVPGRSAILIHSGNTIKDTHGCILVGDSFGEFNGLPGIRNSVVTLATLRLKLPDSFTLTIK